MRDFERSDGGGGRLARNSDDFLGSDGRDGCLSSVLPRLGLGDSDGWQGLSGNGRLLDSSSNRLAFDDGRNDFIVDICDILNDAEHLEGHIDKVIVG